MLKRLLFPAVMALAFLFISLPVWYNQLHGRMATVGIASEDFVANSWISWHIQQARRDLFKYPSVKYTPYLFYPHPSVNYAFPNLFNAILYSFILDYGNYVATWNLLIMIIIALNFISCWLLVNYLLKDRWLALTASFLFMSSSFLYFEIYESRLEIIPVAYICLTILYLLRSFEEKKIIYALTAGLWMGFSGLTMYFYIGYIMIFAAAYLIYLVATGSGKKRVFEYLLTIAVCLVVAAAVLLPFFYADKDILMHEGIYNKANALKKSMPNNLTLLKLLAFSGTYRVSYILMVAALIALFFRNIGAKARVWLGLFFVYLLMSPGNYIKLGADARVPTLFYAVRKLIPFMARDLYAGRYIFMAGMSGGIAAAYLLGYYFKPKGKSKIKIAAMIFVCLAAYADTAFLQKDYGKLLNGYELKIPEIYGRIKKDGGAVLPVPFPYAINSPFYQIWHERPLVNFEGKRMGSYFTDEYVAFVKSNNFLQGLMLLNYPINIKAYADKNMEKLRQGLGELRDSGVRFIVFQKEFRTFSQFEEWAIKLLRDDYKHIHLETVSSYPLAWEDRALESAYAVHKEFLGRFFEKPYLDERGMLVYKLY